MGTTPGKPGNCPSCGHPFDADTSVFGEGRPRPGDLALCIGCGAFLRYSADLTRRLLADSEFNSLPEQIKAQLRCGRKAINLTKAQMN